MSALQKIIFYIFLALLLVKLIDIMIWVVIWSLPTVMIYILFAAFIILLFSIFYKK